MLRNAFRHAQAAWIEVEIRYESRQFACTSAMMEEGSTPKS
ncbi:MAG: hypothetical protein ABI759_07915 [Candidatus Solibacter sp.]